MMKNERMMIMRKGKKYIIPKRKNDRERNTK